MSFIYVIGPSDNGLGSLEQVVMSSIFYSCVWEKSDWEGAIFKCRPRILTEIITVYDGG